MYENIEAYIERLLNESTPDRPLWNIEQIKEGRPACWNYVDGCMLTALSELGRISGDEKYARFVENYVDYYIADAGSIRGYEDSKYELDSINEGRVLFELYERTGKEKYRLAIEKLNQQLENQPRTEEGCFWHKAIYPNQVWLDGIYMAHPFMALYEKTFGSADYSDILLQIDTVYRRMRAANGLYYHGYDVTREAFWAKPGSGCSRNFWLRAIGWYSVALVDLLEITGAPELVPVFRRLMRAMARFADRKTGMYYQVVNRGRRAGNYLETSGSSMVAYAMLKGARLGYLNKKYAAKGKKTFDGICNQYLSAESGSLNLGGICIMAGLGPDEKPWRDGSYKYYLSEPIVENDAKGVAPFLLCYTEIIR